MEIFEFLKNEEKFGGFWWKHKTNPCQPRALIPYDAGRSRFSRICAEGKDEHEEHVKNDEHEKGKSNTQR